MKRNTILILVFSSMVVATVAYAARSLRDPGEADQTENNTEAASADDEATPAASKPVVVKTAVVKTATLSETVTATGVTAAKREVVLSSEIAGKIQYLGADLGDQVRKGKVLARIDTNTLRAEQKRAKANYALAKATYDRFASLGEDIVSRQQIDETHSAMTTANVGLTIADANVAKSVVKSNIKGIVTAKHMEKGEFATPGAPIFSIVDFSTIVVEAQLAETEVAAIRSGADVSVTVNALGETFKGEVETILPLADAASKTFTVRVEMDNPDLEVLVGMSASIAVSTNTHEDVIVVPQDVIIEGKEGRTVFVANGNTAEARPVTLGATENDQVIIEDGISEGETLVVVGHRSLEDGQAIRIAK